MSKWWIWSVIKKAKLFQSGNTLSCTPSYTLEFSMDSQTHEFQVCFPQSTLERSYKILLKSVLVGLFCQWLQLACAMQYAISTILFLFCQSCPTLETLALLRTGQAPLSTGFSRQEYWSRLPSPSPGNVPGSGIKFASLVAPALAGEFLTS